MSDKTPKLSTDRRSFRHWVNKNRTRLQNVDEIDIFTIRDAAFLWFGYAEKPSEDDREGLIDFDAKEEELKVAADDGYLKVHKQIPIRQTKTRGRRPRNPAANWVLNLDEDSRKAAQRLEKLMENQQPKEKPIKHKHGYHSEITRSALIEYAETCEQRPAFLFDKQPDIEASSRDKLKNKGFSARERTTLESMYSILVNESPPEDNTPDELALEIARSITNKYGEEAIERIKKKNSDLTGTLKRVLRTAGSDKTIGLFLKRLPVPN